MVDNVYLRVGLLKMIDSQCLVENASNEGFVDKSSYPEVTGGFPIMANLHGEAVSATIMDKPR